MSKRPSFQFYPPDWRRDQSLRLCSMGARGLWIEMMCLMHEGEPYGHLTDLGQPMSAEALGRLVGESATAVKRWLAELDARAVFSRTDTGVIYCRRMVRDEAVRQARAAGGSSGGEHGHKGASHGSKGGRPRSEKGGKKPPLGRANNPPLHTSSSTEFKAPSEALNLSERDAPILPHEGQSAPAPELTSEQRKALSAEMRASVVGLGEVSPTSRMRAH